MAALGEFALLARVEEPARPSSGSGRLLSSLLLAFLPLWPAASASRAEARRQRSALHPRSSIGRSTHNLTQNRTSSALLEEASWPSDFSFSIDPNSHSNSRCSSSTLLQACPRTSCCSSSLTLLEAALAAALAATGTVQQLSRSCHFIVSLLTSWPTDGSSRTPA